MKGLDLHTLAKLDSTTGLRLGSVVLITASLVGIAWSQAADETSFCYRWYYRYVSYLARKLRAQFIFKPPESIPLGQIVALYVLTVAYLVTRAQNLLAFYPAILFGPALYIERLRRQRLGKIEEQVDTFMLALANALKTTPSIGAGLSSVVPVIDEPLKSEVDLCIKEMKLGSTLDQALLHMAARVGSRILDSALSSVLIGRQVGGNLPKVLETTAGTLREMRRLEGVVRTKTASARSQMVVIGVLPFLLLIGLEHMSPGYFEPLTRSFVGYVIIALVMLSWITAVLVARKLLAVDI